MPRMRVHMWRTAVSDSCPAHHRRHSTERTPTAWESERGAKGEKERVSLSSHAGICVRIVDYVATSTRAILCHEYMTRSTRINWHYSYDVVSPATVTRPLLPLPMTLTAFAVTPCPFLTRVFNTTMHNASAILSAAGREKKSFATKAATVFDEWKAYAI